jgi:phosphoribosylanthranilate isomerase
LPVIKALKVRNDESLKEMARYPHLPVLLDTYNPLRTGGTGIPFPWEIAVRARKERDFILSGGLNPLNVREAIEKVRPVGVDVNSGVEANPGRKDPLKLEEFIREVRRSDEKAGQTGTFRSLWGEICP